MPNTSAKTLAKRTRPPMQRRPSSSTGVRRRSTRKKSAPRRSHKRSNTSRYRRRSTRRSRHFRAPHTPESGVGDQVTHTDTSDEQIDANVKAVLQSGYFDRFVALKSPKDEEFIAYMKHLNSSPSSETFAPAYFVGETSTSEHATPGRKKSSVRSPPQHAKRRKTHEQLIGIKKTLKFEGLPAIHFLTTNVTMDDTLVNTNVREEIRKEMLDEILEIRKSTKNDFAQGHSMIDTDQDHSILSSFLSQYKNKRLEIEILDVPNTARQNWKKATLSWQTKQDGSFEFEIIEDDKKHLDFNMQALKEMFVAYPEPNKTSRRYRLPTQNMTVSFQKELKKDTNYMYILYDTPLDQPKVMYTLTIGEYNIENEWYSKHGVLSGHHRTQLLGAGILRRLHENVLYIDNMSGTFRPKHLEVSKHIIETMTGYHVVAFNVEDLVQHKSSYLVQLHPDMKNI